MNRKSDYSNKKSTLCSLMLHNHSNHFNANVNSIHIILFFPELYYKSRIIKVRQVTNESEPLSLSHKSLSTDLSALWVTLSGQRTVRTANYKLTACPTVTRNQCRSTPKMVVPFSLLVIGVSECISQWKPANYWVTRPILGYLLTIIWSWIDVLH